MSFSFGDQNGVETKTSKVIKDYDKLAEFIHESVFPKLDQDERNYLAQWFTVLFSDGFESDDYSAWDGTSTAGTGTIATSNAQAHWGTFSSHSTITAGFDSAYCHVVFTDESDPEIRFFIRFVTIPGVFEHQDFFSLYSDNGTVHILTIRLIRNGGAMQLELYHDAGANTDNVAWTPNTNQWYCFKVRATLGVVGGNFTTEVDNSVFNDFDVDTSGDNDADQIRIGLVNFPASAQDDAENFIDDVEVADVEPNCTTTTSTTTTTTTTTTSTGTTTTTTATSTTSTSTTTSTTSTSTSTSTSTTSTSTSTSTTSTSTSTSTTSTTTQTSTTTTSTSTSTSTTSTTTQTSTTSTTTSTSTSTSTTSTTTLTSTTSTSTSSSTSTSTSTTSTSTTSTSTTSTSTTSTSTTSTSTSTTSTSSTSTTSTTTPSPPICVTLSLSEWDINLNISEWNIVLELECDGVPSQGETFRVTGTLIDLDGNIVTNLSGAVHSIRTFNPAGTLVDTEIAPTYTGASGIWTQDFSLAAAAPIGGWRVFWIVTLGGTVGIAKLPFWVDDP